MVERASSAINAAYGDAVTVLTGAEGVYSAAFQKLGLGAAVTAKGKPEAMAFLNMLITDLARDGWVASQLRQRFVLKKLGVPTLCHKAAGHTPQAYLGHRLRSL